MSARCSLAQRRAAAKSLRSLETHMERAKRGARRLSRARCFALLRQYVRIIYTLGYARWIDNLHLFYARKFYIFENFLFVLSLAHTLYLFIHMYYLWYAHVTAAERSCRCRDRRLAAMAFGIARVDCSCVRTHKWTHSAWVRKRGGAYYFSLWNMTEYFANLIFNN